jgi:epoxide hydrolase-like predicted phosphatase
MSIRAVIFDLGGVLLRTEDPSPRRELAARLGLTREQIYYHVFDSPSARQATLGQITSDEHWESIRQGLGLTSQDFPSVRQAFWGGDRLDTELVETIRSLRPRYKTALLSNAWGDMRQVLTERWKIADAFDELVISAEVGIAKPDPRIYRLTLERLGVPAGEAVFVDDFIENIEAARALGLHTVHFRSPEQAGDELGSLLGDARPQPRLEGL